MALTQEEIVRVLLAARVRVSAAAWLVVRDAQAAEDIFQNVTLKAISGRAVFEQEAQLLSWAHVTARNEALNVVRSRGSRVAVLDPAVLELIEGQWPSPADGGEAQRVEALRQCVGALGADARRMLDLRYSQGRACAEVGRELGVGLEAVYQRLSRLHRSLRQCIEKRLSNAGGSAS